MNKRPTVLVTGASRKVGIGASIARSLAKSGWNIALTYWRPYDDSMPWGCKPEEVAELITEIEEYGSEVYSVEADLSNPESVPMIIQKTIDALGNITALVLSHCYSVDRNIQTTTIGPADLPIMLYNIITYVI